MIKDIENAKGNVLIADMKIFSEGVNLTMFVNLIILYGDARDERLRQCVGRLVRSNHLSKTVSVYYIGSKINNVILSTVPRETILDNIKYLGKNSIAISDRTINFKSGMSDEEKVVLTTKTAYPDSSVGWIRNRNGFSAYTEQEILCLLRKKN